MVTKLRESITLDDPMMCVFVGMTVAPATAKYCKAYAARLARWNVCAYYRPYAGISGLIFRGRCYVTRFYAVRQGFLHSVPELRQFRLKRVGVQGCSADHEEMHLTSSRSQF